MRRDFTLVELIVVLVIIMLLTGLAVSSLRGESPSAALNRNTLELEAFLARVRFLCAESGRDYVVRWYPDDRMFCAHADYTEEELRDMEGSVTDGAFSERFKFPENVEVFTVEGAEDAAREQEYVEIFRFYPTGGASCVNRPGMRIGTLARFFDISFFSGRLIGTEGDGAGAEKK